MAMVADNDGEVIETASSRLESLGLEGDVEMGEDEEWGLEEVDRETALPRLTPSLASDDSEDESSGSTTPTPTLTATALFVPNNTTANSRALSQAPVLAAPEDAPAEYADLRHYHRMHLDTMVRHGWVREGDELRYEGRAPIPVRILVSFWL